MADTPPELHAIILSFNEEQHIGRCIESIRDLCTSITVIDSGSKDRTVDIAESLGARVISNPWKNYATQFNFGIDQIEGRTGWCLRIDSDEYFTEDSRQSLLGFLADQPKSVTGILVNRQIVFMGKRIKRGGIEPSWQLRLWRAGEGRCEQRWMDEHIVTSGDVIKSKLHLVDENLNSIDWWTEKHNKYASREVIDIFASQGALKTNQDIEAKGAAGQAKLKRFIKDNIYNRLPGGLRSMMYVFFRYVILLGFLDGKPGYYFHVLQGFWYRTLVDAKMTEIRDHAKQHNMSLVEAIRIKTGFDLSEQSE